jgi:hypothetical protein
MMFKIMFCVIVVCWLILVLALCKAAGRESREEEKRWEKVKKRGGIKW